MFLVFMILGNKKASPFSLTLRKSSGKSAEILKTSVRLAKNTKLRFFQRINLSLKIYLREKS